MLAISDRRLLTVDGQDTDSQDTDSQDTDSQDTDSQDTDSQDATDWRERFVHWRRRLIADGVDGLQVREKDLSDRDFWELLELLGASPNANRPNANRTKESRKLLVLVNGRIDFALAAGLDGVHLPAAGLGIAALRRRFGDRLVIGRSTHHPDEVVAARRAGADYVTFGPIFETPSKVACGSPPGLEGLRRATACGLPVLALGGIGPDDVPAVARAGAAGVAGIRVFHHRSERRRLVAACRQLWPTAEAG